MKNPQSIMRARMAMYATIRAFFTERQVCEVETPMLSPYGSTDVHIDSFVTHWDTQARYLQTSPEFAMKQLLAQGFGDCFQIAKVFRNEPSGRYHNPEFTLLEWYRVGFTMHQLMDEVALLMQSISPPWNSLPIEQLTYAQAFAQIGINPHRDDLPILKQCAEEHAGYLPNLSDNRDEWLDFLLVTQIEPHLGQDKLTFLTHYPASMAALAKLSRDAEGNTVAARFELYYQGIELANGFDELTDADEQLARFQADNRERKTIGKPELPVDTRLISALRQGMPDCAGVAVGLDRVLMLSAGITHFDELIGARR